MKASPLAELKVHLVCIDVKRGLWYYFIKASVLQFLISLRSMGFEFCSHRDYTEWRGVKLNLGGSFVVSGVTAAPSVPQDKVPAGLLRFITLTRSLSS